MLYVEAKGVVEFMYMKHKGHARVRTIRGESRNFKVQAWVLPEPCDGGGVPQASTEGSGVGKRKLLPPGKLLISQVLVQTCRKVHAKVNSPRGLPTTKDTLSPPAHFKQGKVRCDNDDYGEN